MTGLHIEPLTEAQLKRLGPWYVGEDAERRNELVAAVRELLPAALGAALALPFEERRTAAIEATATLAERGDDLQYGSGQGMDALAAVVATLIIQPGGVKLFSHHWCLDHAVCEAVREVL